MRTALVDCGAAGDPRVRIAANGTREGPGISRNVALGRASAPLIQNLDADDELEPDALEVLATALAEHPAAGFAVGPARDLLGSGDLVEFPVPFPPGVITRGSLARHWVTDLDAYRLPVHPAGVMWRRGLLIAAGGWSALHNMEDTGLLMSASALAPGVVVDRVTLRYRRHRNQRSTQRQIFEGGANITCASTCGRTPRRSWMGTRADGRQRVGEAAAGAAGEHRAPPSRAAIEWMTGAGACLGQMYQCGGRGQVPPGVSG
ncbi:glycosyltransferase family 2 protein [Nocardia cyriacigeorgica]|uniref:glycosyltransferase family 2 protein n=1 Tax=Nocardia cyriacigeorgica TaxID=135487 RepID=UPI002456EA05|nr:glycosyltransferase [Nocardia cyriacigeorgica]